MSWLIASLKDLTSATKYPLLNCSIYCRIISTVPFPAFFFSFHIFTIHPRKAGFFSSFRLLIVSILELFFGAALNFALLLFWLSIFKTWLNTLQNLAAGLCGLLLISTGSFHIHKSSYGLKLPFLFVLSFLLTNIITGKHQELH